MTKNEYVFHSVTGTGGSTRRCLSIDTRCGVHGEPAEKKFQRSASAPRVSRTVHGSMTLPCDFDIFWPSWSTSSARHTTLRYGVRPNTSVFTASSE